MPDTGGTGDTHVAEVDLGTLSGRAVVVRDRRGTGTDGAALTRAPRTGPTTLWREGRER